MGDVTKNFSRWEWACRCGCGFDDLHPVVVMGIQIVRDVSMLPVFLNSGCRCHQHNEDEGGEDFSYHLEQANGYGWAVDWTIPGARLFEMLGWAAVVEAFFKGGIGIYVDGDEVWIHSDTRRGGPARWGFLDGEETDFDAVLKAAEKRGI